MSPGSSHSAADARLRKAELVAGRVSTQPADQPAGTVIGQEPRCGPRPRDNRVNLVVSSGLQSEPPRPERESGGTSIGDVAVPVGIVVGAAVLGAILAAGSGSDDGSRPGEPSGKRRRRHTAESAVAGGRSGETGITDGGGRKGDLADARCGNEGGARIDREHSYFQRGRALVEVPDLTGLDWQTANTRTSGARLRMLVTDPQASDLAGMTVASQVPVAGTRVLAGATVGVRLRGVEGVPAAAPAAALPPAPPPEPAPPPDPPAAAQARAGCSCAGRPRSGSASTCRAGSGSCG